MKKESYMTATPEYVNNPDPASDYETIRRVLEGKINVYCLLVKRYQVPVFNLLLHMMNNRSEAEELTQIVFIKAYEALPSFRFEFRFFSWIYRIAINEALAHLKQHKRYASTDGMAQLSDNTDEGNRDKEEWVQHAIKHLNNKHKTVVMLKYYHKLSYKEIAFVLEITENKVRSRLYEARIRLKSILEQTSFFLQSDAN